MRALNLLGATGIVCLCACGPPAPAPPPLTADEREILERLTAWSPDITFEEIQRHLPSLERTEQPFPIPLRTARGKVAVFDVEFDAEFQFGDEGLVKAGYFVEDLGETGARALYERVRFGLRELYGEYEEEESEDPRLIGRQATWSIDERAVSVIMVSILDETGWAVLWFVVYGSGTIPWPQSGT